MWQSYSTQYPSHTHERAAAAFLSERGFQAIGDIIATHGYPHSPATLPKTTEQKVLAYSDKRVRFETIVSVEERFDDLRKRYGDGSRESAAFTSWKQSMLQIEQELFGGDPLLP